MRGNPVIHFVNVFVFHDGGHGGLLVSNLNFDNLLGVFLGFLFLFFRWNLRLFGFHMVERRELVGKGVISFISIMIDGKEMLFIIKKGQN